MPGSSNVASKVACKGVSDPSSPLVSRIREACSTRFPVNGFGASIVYVLGGHSGVYVGKARLDRKRMCGMGPRALEHLRARILRRSLGSVFMLAAMWCDSEVRALATEAVLIKLESPLCNVVDGLWINCWETVQGQGQEKTTIVLASQVQAPVYKYLEPSVGFETLYTGVRSVLGIEVPWSS